MNIFKKLGAMAAGIVLASAFLANTAFAANYTVQSKDTLYSIGQLFRSSSATIRSDNGLSSNMIHPGQVLYVRASTYTVKSGDSLYLIAKKLGVSLDLLRKANNKWNNTIYPGQKLAVPASAGSSAAAFSPASIHYTQAEVDLLARLVRAEAESEPYNAKVGVAAVVVNRVKSDLFPNSIASVIYEKDSGYYQFTPVENGWINKPARDIDRQAALDALKGSDPSHGALYYFDDSATNKWLWSKPILARIGHMVYVY